MENIDNKIVDIIFDENNNMIISYDNEQTETLAIGKDTYYKMYKEPGKHVETPLFGLKRDIDFYIDS